MIGEPLTTGVAAVKKGQDQTCTPVVVQLFPDRWREQSGARDVNIVTASPSGIDEQHAVVVPDARDPRPVIAIMGGGFSGGALAYHLAQSQVPLRIVVFEPRARIGAGLAYDTDEPTNRINVPADRMALRPGDDGDFPRWIAAGDRLADDPEARTADGRLFPRRSLFGAYVAAKIAPLVADGSIEHRRARVTSVRRDRNGWRVEADGTILHATQFVIATTHPPPTPPRELAGLLGDPRVVWDPLAAGWADTVGVEDRILVVGTGLTMADTIAALDRRGHKGPILAVSRRGLRSRAHGEVAWPPFGDFVSTPARTALDLLRRTKATLKDAVSQDMTWHPVIDALRGQGQAIWAQLPVAEQRRLIRWLRPYWDVHRFRIAPAVDAVLDRLIAEKRLTVRAARLHAVDADAAGITVALRMGKPPTVRHETVDRVIVTTGPGHADILRHQPALAQLHDAGFLCLDRVGLGLACDREARAIGKDGEPVAGLYIAGPLARGTFGELMGLPQVSEFAAYISTIVLRTLTIDTTEDGRAAPG